MHYRSAILAFLGAPHWGLAMAEKKWGMCGAHVSMHALKKCVFCLVLCSLLMWRIYSDGAVTRKQSIFWGTNYAVYVWCSTESAIMGNSECPKSLHCTRWYFFHYLIPIHVNTLIPTHTSLNCSLLGFVCGGLHSGCLCSTTWLAAVVVHASPRSVDLSSAYGVGSDVVKAGVISR